MTLRSLPREAICVCVSVCLCLYLCVCVQMGDGSLVGKGRLMIGTHTVRNAGRLEQRKGGSLQRPDGWRLECVQLHDPRETTSPALFDRIQIACECLRGAGGEGRSLLQSQGQRSVRSIANRWGRIR